MKKFVTLAVIIFCVVGTVFSQDSALTLSISGEARTGFFAWWKERDVYFINDKNNVTGALRPDEGADIHYSELTNWMMYTRLDDNRRRSDQGLYRLNFQIERGNIGAKFRFEMANFSEGIVNWEYAYLYGSFFNDQFRTSAGKLGESPWGTGEFEFRRELDTTIGMRFEYLPFFVPGLELGLVLNDWNTDIPSGETATLKDLLRETVFGIAYTHDYFHARFAYRLDSEADRETLNQRGQGGRITYRVEERILGNYLPDLQIWNVGYFEEIGNENKYALTGTNYLYAQYDPYNFTAQLRLGYDIIDGRLLPNGGRSEKSRQWFSVRPSFYYKFFDDLLTAGLAFLFEKDFGSGFVSPSYLSWYIEPQIRVNLDQFYIAFVYRYHDDYYQLDNQDDWSNPNPVPYNSRTHWLNLRVVFTF